MCLYTYCTYGESTVPTETTTILPKPLFSLSVSIPFLLPSLPNNLACSKSLSSQRRILTVVTQRKRDSFLPLRESGTAEEEKRVLAQIKRVKGEEERGAVEVKEKESQLRERGREKRGTRMENQLQLRILSSLHSSSCFFVAFGACLATFGATRVLANYFLTKAVEKNYDFHRPCPVFSREKHLEFFPHH